MICLILLLLARVIYSTDISSDSFKLFSIKHFKPSNKSDVSSWEVSRFAKSEVSQVDAVCNIQTIGYLYTHSKSNIDFRHGGRAEMTVLEENPFLTNCVYMTFINAQVRKIWRPRIREDPLGSLGVVIQCPVPNTLRGRDMCKKFEQKNMHLQMTIFSSKRNVQTAPEGLVASIEYSPHADLQLPANKLARLRGSNAVITVQTFRNRISGPMLYMFIKYYTNLGWPVIIYDRYGLHADFVKDFVDSVDVIYHPYTLFESVFPHDFNRSAVNVDDTDFKYWHFFSAFLNETKVNIDIVHSYMKRDDMLNQDDDKRATLNHASQQYMGLVQSLFYVDRDEFLHCPSVQSSVPRQRQYQQSFVNDLVAAGIDEVKFVRYNYASRSPSGVVKTDKELSAILENCIRISYEEKSLAKFWSCYTSYSVFKTKEKCVYVPDSCPFHDLHAACIRCRCNSTVIGNSRNKRKCHIVHLSNTLIDVGSTNAVNQMKYANVELVNMWKSF
mmetsp:Transcript_19819/g.28501  ORF Transcript_19819/g.28501 Transcript_19819/m.28501 type:complete len:499 (-) Transcript_19819:50-1546(-)